MKKTSAWGVFVLSVLLCLMACGKTDDDAAATNTVTRSLAGSFSVAGDSSADTTNYYVWTQNRGTKEVQFDEVDADGDFSVSIDTSDDTTSGKNIFMGIVKKDPFRYIGPVVIGNTPANGVVSTGMDVSGNVQALEIVLDESKNRADLTIPSSATNAVLNSTMSTRLDANSIPVGAGNVGKGSESKTSSPVALNTIDQDSDGVPDIFDAMNDGAMLDNLSEDTNTEAVLASSAVRSASMFMNLKVAAENVASGGVVDVTANAIITIEVVAETSHDITAIKAHTVHTNYSTATIAPFPAGFTQVDTYPSTGSSWSVAGVRNLYRATNPEGDTIWTVFINPGNNDFMPGDLVLLEVTKTSGTEYIWIDINFKFTRVIHHDLTTYSDDESGTKSDPYVIQDTGGRVFRWEPPHDETDAELPGITYSFEVFFFDQNHNQLEAMNLTIDATEGDIDVESTGPTIMKGDLSEAEINDFTISSGGTTPSYMQVDIKSSYPYGDNSAMLIYLKRASWPDPN